MPTKLETAQQKLAVADTEFKAAALNRKAAILNAYDGAETTRKRRNVNIEMQGEDEILSASKRLRGVAATRDLERNYTNARGLIKQFRVNVVGPLGKLNVNTPNGKDAAGWFNGIWAKECDARDDNHWSDILQSIVASVMREGDVGVVVDDGWLDNDGKLWMWEADQFVKINQSEFDLQYGPKNYTQDGAIVRDQWGRIVGYHVSGKRGMQQVPLKDATFFSRDVMRLVKRPWRVNQGRGVADMLTAANDLFDNYDFRSRELQTAKVAASLAGFVKRTDAVSDFDNPLGQPQLLSEALGQTQESMQANQSEGGAAPNYENFEALTGGFMDYLDKNDEMELFDINRPNVNAAEFHDFIMTSAGSSMGIARAYSRMRADSSYTSFRGDMIMSWATFYDSQKWLERRLCDWVASKVLPWGVANAGISLDTGWQTAIGWQWPVMPEVDEAKAENAARVRIKNGRTTWQEQLGPDWESKFEQLAIEADKARGLDLPLSLFETLAGAERTDDEIED